MHVEISGSPFQWERLFCDFCKVFTIELWKISCMWCEINCTTLSAWNRMMPCVLTIINSLEFSGNSPKEKSCHFFCLLEISFFLACLLHMLKLHLWCGFQLAMGHRNFEHGNLHWGLVKSVGSLTIWLKLSWRWLNYLELHWPSKVPFAPLGLSTCLGSLYLFFFRCFLSVGWCKDP